MQLLNIHKYAPNMQYMFVITNKQNLSRTLAQACVSPHLSLVFTAFTNYHFYDHFYLRTNLKPYAAEKPIIVFLCYLQN